MLAAITSVTVYNLDLHAREISIVTFTMCSGILQVTVAVISALNLDTSAAIQARIWMTKIFGWSDWK